jgi:hypothetical protein
VIAALNTNVGYVGTWIASVITLGLAAFIVWIVGLVVATPVPVLATAEASVAAANGGSRVGQPPVVAGV